MAEENYEGNVLRVRRLRCPALEDNIWVLPIMDYHEQNDKEFKVRKGKSEPKQERYKAGEEGSQCTHKILAPWKQACVVSQSMGVEHPSL